MVEYLTPGDMRDHVRLLIAAPGAGEVFTDAQIDLFIATEGSVKLAAAQAVTVIALNEALVSKVIKDGQMSTDGAKLSAELRAHAAALRASHDREVAESDEGTFFGLATMPDHRGVQRPELTEGFLGSPWG